MKRIVSSIVMILFIMSQTSVYAQVGIPRPISTTQRRVRINNVVDLKNQGVEKDDAMVKALYEAEMRQTEEKKEMEKRLRLKGPVRGKREQKIIRGYSQKKDNKPNITFDMGLDDSGQDQKKLRKINVKKQIPRNADLGRGFVKKINEKLYPVKISGDYQMAWGYDWGDDDSEGQRGIWKSADWNQANLVYALDNQYIFGLERENTYDKRVFSSFRLKMESVRETGFNFLSETVVDPWSFVGKTDPIVITGSNGAQLPLQMRYWSNTGRTVGERIVLSNGADFVNIPEIAVDNGQTRHSRLVSRWAGAIFDVPPMDINRDFRPMRKLEVNYTSDRLKFKVFPLADHDHAFTTDDPLILSNKHIYWEPSPWLKYWKSGQYFGPTNDFIRGDWKADIPFESRDSDFNFLTLLRGLSFEFNYEDFYVGGATAAPLTLWQDYASVNSLPGVIRMKQRLFDDKRFYVGSLYGYNYGFEGGHVAAFNHLWGIDGGYEVPENYSFRGQVAWSIDERDHNQTHSSIVPTEAEGGAFKLESKGNFLHDKSGNPQIKVQSSFTHMGDGFRPRLSNYRNTRDDQFWSKHISFEDVDPGYEHFKLGDGADIGRNVLHFRMENEVFSGTLNSLYDMRFVRGGAGRKIEDVYREEITFNPLSNLSGKFLFRYQDLPGTTLGRDPYIITDFISGDDTDEYLINNDIGSGEDADRWTWSTGVHYDPVKWFGIEGIFERTNDYDIFPQLVLNDAGFRDLGDIRELNYFLYGQPLIAVPDYDPYNIYKARIFWKPMDSFRTKFEYVINQFKHATGRDDNISHWGIEIDMDITKKLVGAFKYTRSQLVDLFRQQQGFEDVPFNHHNNIFTSLTYQINKNNTFVTQFGEFFNAEEYTPVPWLLNTVSTQRIIRFYLKGTF